MKAQNPNITLQPGCQLVSVNGVCDSYNEVNRELWTAGKKVIEILEGSLVESCVRHSAGDIGTETCAICFEDVETDAVLAQLPCKHAFHEECISHWFSRGKGSCPLCNRFVSISKGGDGEHDQLGTNTCRH